MPPSDPQLYDYPPITDRPRLTWPGDARIAVWVAPNIEFYELEPPPNPVRRAWPRGQPDVTGYSYRDYGNRVGIWRILERPRAATASAGSVALNVALCEHHPEIIEACRAASWEFFSHGVYNTRYLFGMDETQERGGHRGRDRDRAPRTPASASSAGSRPPCRTPSARWTCSPSTASATSCDLFHDDQPFPVNVPRGRLISMPYALETNDGIGLRPPPRLAARVRRDPPGPVRPALPGGRRVRTRDVHPAPPVPVRTAASRGARSTGRSRTSRRHAGVWLATGARDRRLVLRVPLRARASPASPRGAAGRRAGRRDAPPRLPCVSAPPARDGPRPLRVVAAARRVAGGLAGRRARGAGRHADAPVVPARHDGERRSAPIGRAGRALSRTTATTATGTTATASGIFRIMAVLDRLGLPATCRVNGIVAKRYPELLAEVVRRRLGGRRLRLAHGPDPPRGPAGPRTRPG